MEHSILKKFWFNEKAFGLRTLRLIETNLFPLVHFLKFAVDLTEYVLSLYVQVFKISLMTGFYGLRIHEPFNTP